MLVLGLAPAAHGANRTGRVFTGDGPLGSGDFLMRAMHAHGFASIPTVAARRRWADAERRVHRRRRALRAARQQADARRDRRLPRRTSSPRSRRCRASRVIVGLGRIAFDAAWRLLADRGIVVRPRPPFGHGAVYETAGYTVIGSYHPSRQNTNTGKLTPPMMDAVFARARRCGSRLSA